jgi:hypothetical protein
MQLFSKKNNNAATNNNEQATNNDAAATAQQPANNAETGASATNTKTTVFNLIILDESGSMIGATESVISGCNETLNVAKAAAEKNPDTLYSLTSIYAFQSGGRVESRYLLHNVRTADARHITAEDYQPYGMTPLLDAVGTTLTQLRAASETHEDATGIITIMTDGLENASTKYTYQDVAKLISGFKEMGWIVNLVGANIDLEQLGNQLNIDAENRVKFENSKSGTAAIFEHLNDCMAGGLFAMADISRKSASVEERRARRKQASKDFFSF